jgi:opacity protein-like surface antigen
MRKAVALAFLLTCAAFAADTDFNGWWDITAPGSAPRAWWLGVQGAGTASPKVSFISDHGGDLNVADEVSFSNGVLTFGFRYKQRRQQGEEPVEVHTVYVVRIDGTRISGTQETEGSSRPPAKWVGVRAPQIKDKDDGTWKEGRPVQLFNAKDLSGWLPLEKERKFNWTVESGVLKAGGGGANLVSDQKFWNFKLHIEYKMFPGSNSGIGLRGRYEIQVQDDFGKPTNIHANGSLYSRIAPSVQACKPAGEWQAYDITLIGRDLTVVLNGTKVIDKKLVEGLTAMGHDPNEAEPGPLSLQGDHGAMEFRNIVITPLAK